MNIHLLTVVLAPCLAFAVLPQEPIPAQPSQPPAAATAETPPGSAWSEGFGRATNYRSALANAIEDAVAKVKGISVARGPAVRSRLSVVSDHKDGDKDGWFNGEADGEREWVQQQIAGFVLRYEVLRKEKGQDGQWEITVKALVAANDGIDTTIVIDLQDNDLRKWQLERFEEGSGSGAFARQSGDFAGPRIAEYLRKSRLVKIVAKGAGVAVGAGSSPREREKAGHQVVASHRVVVAWQPLVVQSMVEKPNKARPTAGPRPEFLSGGAVQVSIKVEDLVENTELLEETFTVPADPGASQSVEQIDAYVNALVDKAKAVVAEKVFFALKPPVVLRKWQGPGGEWLVEAQVARRVAATYAAFAVGNNGSLASPDWQSLGRAVLVDGNDTRCTFRLEGVDTAQVEPNLTEVRPTKK